MVEVANRKPLKLLVEERRRRILDLLDEEDRVTVEDLVERFDVSAVTIRGDLDALADGGSLVRSHGGALKRLDEGDIRISVKETLNHREKLRIGHAAARLIRRADTIILDSGTTTAEIAKQIKSLKLDSLTVITNGLNVAMHLADLPHVRLIVIGGLMRHMSYSTVGPQAEQMLGGLNADHLFLGVDGLDPGDRPDHARRARGAAEFADDPDGARSDRRRRLEQVLEAQPVGDRRRRRSPARHHRPQGRSPSGVDAARSRGRGNAGVIARPKLAGLVVLAVCGFCLGAEAGVRAVWAIGDGDKVKRDDHQHPGRREELGVGWPRRSASSARATRSSPFQVIVEADGAGRREAGGAAAFAGRRRAAIA